MLKERDLKYIIYCLESKVNKNRSGVQGEKRVTCAETLTAFVRVVNAICLEVTFICWSDANAIKALILSCLAICGVNTNETFAS